MIRSLLTLVCGLLSIATTAAEVHPGILVCVAADAPPTVRAAAEALVKDADRVPLLALLRRDQGAGAVELQDSAALLADKAFPRAANNHLVVIGVRGADPLLERCWGETAALDPATRTAYAEGYGHLRGPLAWIESDRNPFLHSQKVDSSPFDTWQVRIGGVDAASTVAAVAAFRGGMLTGFVVAGTLERPSTTLLDLDPLAAPPPALPDALPFGKGTARYSGWHQLGAVDYRALLERGGREPLRAWRAKWVPPNAFAGVGAEVWMRGFHRRAYRNAATIAEFADPAAASAAAAAIGGSWKKLEIGGKPAWTTDSPTDESVEERVPVIVSARGKFLVLAALPAESVTAIVAGLPAN